MILTFGQFKGQKLEDVPTSYLQYIVEHFEDGVFKTEAKDVLARRLIEPGKGYQAKVDRDTALGSLYGVIKRMPEDLYGKNLIIDKKFKVRIDVL